MSGSEGRDVLLRAEDVSAGYSLNRRGPTVLHDVTLEVAAHRTIGIVGESGSGKSTLARVLVGQLRPTQGRVLLGGEDLGTLRGRSLRAARRRIQLVPQDPYASLDPRMNIRRALAEAIDPTSRRARQHDERISELLRTVALDPDVADRYPHEFSGGQRQRIAIARALAVEPEVIIADEVTSSLDSSVQAEILNLLQAIQARTGIGLIFITHNLSVANYLCDEVCVLYLGRIVERGSTDVLFRPDHPYTRVLVESVPGFDAVEGQFSVAGADDAADPMNPPSGCPYHPRCPVGPTTFAERQVCTLERPALLTRWSDACGQMERSTACHFPLTDGAHDNAMTARNGPSVPPGAGGSS